MKSTRQISRLLEAAQKDRKTSQREYFRAPSGHMILCESKSEYDWWEQFTGAMSGGDLRPNDFSLREMFDSFVPNGRSIADAWRNGDSISLQEAAGAVSASQFSNITGQIVYSKILEGFQNEEFKFSKLIPTVSTQFNGERIPGIGGIGDQAEVVGEGQTYPLAGLSEDYIDTPPTLKRGLIVPVTKEAIFFDRTALVLKRAGEVGEFLGLNKEKRAIDCVIDENTTAARYRWRGNVIATYGDNSGTHTWDNLQASNALVDWTDIDAVELLFSNILDPNTGEPIVVMANTLVCTPQLAHTANYIKMATGFAMQSGGFATSGNLVRTDGRNPIGGTPFSSAFNVVSSRQLASRMTTDTTWYLGDPAGAFAYMENFPLRVDTAPTGSDDEFKRDIVTQFKASERGAYATMEPRKMAKSTVA